MDFVLEVGVEELPASYVDIGVEHLSSFFKNALFEKGIDADISSYGTPRRLSIFISGLPQRTREYEEILRGPIKKVAFDEEGKPTKALLSFLEKNNGRLEDVVDVETKKGVYVGLKVKRGGEYLKDILPSISRDAIFSIPFPKTMRWKGPLRFGRPIRWILALLDDEVLSVDVDGIGSSRETFGHRILAKGKVKVDRAGDYLRVLREHFVEPSKDERKKIILDYLSSLSQKGLSWLEDEELLSEVANLVEYPFPVLGRFDERFLELPREVVVNVLKVHQRFFALEEKGKLSTCFVGVSNNRANEEIREGYERVVSARLNDAMFFLEEDLKLPFGDERLSMLREIMFFQGLGSMYDKTMRLMELVEAFVRALGGDEKKAKRAAYLSKMDMTTHMVYEFPELQGVMGRYYALRFGEDKEVSEAIFEQYLPRFSGDKVPETPTGIALSLADKIDTLVGFFGLKKEPTGSADPHGLRRAAIGVVLTVVEKRVRFNLPEVLERAFELYKGTRFKRSKEEVVREVFSFIKTRMENLYDYRKDAINAVFSLDLPDLYSYHLRIKALGEEREKGDFMDVFIPFKRVVNITKDFAGGEVNPELFEAEEEKRLYEEYLRVKRRFDELLSKEDFPGILSLFREIKPHVDAFFDNVFVMVEDEAVRNNRLSLLKLIASMFSEVADFTKFSL